MNRVYFSLAIMFITLSCSKEEQWDATGTFEATEIIVSAESNGRILSFNLLEGDIVEAGEVLGVIDTIQLHYKAKELSLGLKAADISKPDISKQIAALKQQKSSCEMELARAVRLVEANAGNTKSVDDLTNQIALIKSQIEAQESTLSKSSHSTDVDIESKQYQLMSINDLIAKCNITNPQRGTVLAKYAEVGEMATVGKPLYKVADMELIYLRAYVTDSQLQDVKLGDTVTVQTDGGGSYDGIITWISQRSEFTPKGILTKDERANLVYAIKIAVKNSGALKIGQYGEVKL